MPAEIRFGTFIAALMTILEYGTEDAPVMCTHTVRSVREALVKVKGERRAYLQFHSRVLAPYTAQVRDAITSDIKDAIYKLAAETAVVRRHHPLVPPPPGRSPVSRLFAVSYGRL